MDSYASMARIGKIFNDELI